MDRAWLNEVDGVDPPPEIPVEVPAERHRGDCRVV